MNIRWQLAAVSDLSDIRTYISEENPAAAEAALKGRFVEYMWGGSRPEIAGAASQACGTV